MLWPEQPQSAASNNLRQMLFRLRRALPDGHLAVSDTTVRLDDCDVDAIRFQDLLAECAIHEHPGTPGCPDCTPRPDMAVALYRGEFLAGVFPRSTPALEDWMLVQREQHREQAGP